MTRAPRQNKTPRQRAEEALGVAERRLAKAIKKRDAAKAAVSVAEREVTAAESRLRYVQADPALPQTGQDPDPEGKS